MSESLDQLENPGACRVLIALSRGEKTTKQIADALGVQPPSVSEQLRKLREAGYVERGEKVGKHQKYVLKKDVISDKFIQKSTLGTVLGEFKKPKERMDCISDFPVEWWVPQWVTLMESENAGRPLMLIEEWCSYIWDTLETQEKPPDLKEIRDAIRESARQTLPVDEGYAVPSDKGRYVHDLDLVKLAERVREDLKDNVRFHHLVMNFMNYFAMLDRTGKHGLQDIARNFEFVLCSSEYLLTSIEITRAEDWQKNMVMCLLSWIYIIKNVYPDSFGLHIALSRIGFTDQVLPSLAL